MTEPQDAEATRLQDDELRKRNWKRWGPYLSERQWGTVREDYSEDGEAWLSFTHEHARSRAYRWGEDGLLGICDRQGRLCFALALWNGRDPILKERLFGLAGPEGNHGEDVKESYFYLDATPTSSYLKALYKYPQIEFPYEKLREENRQRNRSQPEFELAETGAFDERRYFDVTAEYAKATDQDILIRIVVANRGPEAAPIHVLPSLWFRNSWAWGRQGEGYPIRPSLSGESATRVRAKHATLGEMTWDVDASQQPTLLFTDNDTRVVEPLASPSSSYFKDAFHEYVVHARSEAVNPRGTGTKAAAHYALDIGAGQQVTLRCRLRASDEATAEPFGAEFDSTFDKRIQEAHAFYENVLPKTSHAEERLVARQAYAGLLWSKQFYYYAVEQWLEGDPGFPTPPEARKSVRNQQWKHLYNRDVISMPDKWEYPWYAAWDLAFHMIPFARIDPHFAKQQLLLFLREWYMHPNGQLPAYEYGFDDVNPPVHAWAAWRVYKMTGARGQRDQEFLARVFQKLLLNFTWWVNRKDAEGNNLFAGGFLGLDNIGVFDRSKGVPDGGRLEQADGTAWMAFYCGSMLSMALELAKHDRTYSDMASKFFEHFIQIVDAMNSLGGSGLWDEEDGFYYDKLHHNNTVTPMRIRSIVGIIPLFAVEVLKNDVIDQLPEFKKRMQWFLENRTDLSRHVSYLESSADDGRRLLAVPSRERLERVLRFVFDENEFLSPHGVRSMSRVHREQPFVLSLHGTDHHVSYAPGESDTNLFGGNSNWRGPVWLPLNFLLIESLERYDYFYGDSFKVECPTGSGNWVRLHTAAQEIRRRLSRLFLTNGDGKRPCHGSDQMFCDDPHAQDLVLFHEYFHGDDGRGLGASHQTGWTSLIARTLEVLAAERDNGHARTPDDPDGDS